MIFETHAHYDDDAFKDDLPKVLTRIRKANIARIVNVASSMENTLTTMALAEKYEYFYAAIGVHPEETKDMTDDDIARLKEYSKKKKVVAIGEIGLDYHWDEPERAIQKKWFEAQLELAKEVKLPVIIHSRDAAADTLDLMKAHDSHKIGGIIHCFSYGVEMAREYLDMGFYLGIGGVVTFKNGKKLKEVTKYAPLDRLVLETDSPYLAPVPNRGTRNDSSNIPYIIEEIAALKGITPDEVERATWENACRVYGLEQVIAAALR